MLLKGVQMKEEEIENKDKLISVKEAEIVNIEKEKENMKEQLEVLE